MVFLHRKNTSNGQLYIIFVIKLFIKWTTKE